MQFVSVARRPGRAVVAAALLAWMSAAPAEATTVLELSVAEMAERSEVVFVGRVTRQSSRLDVRIEDGIRTVRVWTDTTFAIERVLKGTKRRELTLAQLGGEAGEGTDRIRQVVHGLPTFTVGEEVVVFLERTDTGRLVVTGLAQGKYTLRPDPAGGPPIAVRSTAGLHTVGRRNKRIRRLVGVPPTEDRLTLPQLEALVRGERPVPAPVRIFRTPQVSIPAPGEVAR